MSENVLSDLSNEEVIYITLLMGMYDDNMRQIQQLTSSNNTIRDMLLEMVRRIGRTRTSRTTLSNDSPPLNENILPSTNVLNVTTPTTPTTPPPTSNLNTAFYSMFSHRTPPQAPQRQRRYNNRNYNRNISHETLQTFLIPNTSYFDLSGNDIFNNMPDYGRIFQTFFQPVQITPTSSQIENAIRQVRYGDIIRPINTTCPISLETFDDNSTVSMIRHCGHIFNTDQLSNWFNSNYRCPVCRYDIREYNSNQTSEVDSTNV